MPTTKKLNVQSKKVEKISKKGIYISIAVALLLLLVGVWWFIGKGSMLLVQSQMQSYLTHKYGQDFTVENVRLEGAGIGVRGELDADAYPKNDPSLKFTIGRLEGGLAPKTYSRDTFLQELWSRQGRKQVDLFVKQELPNVENYNLRISPGIAFLESIQGRTPDFSEAQSERPGQFSYELNISSLTHGATANPSDDELQRVFKLIGFVKEQHASKASTLRYTYRIDGGGYAQFEAKDKDMLGTFSSINDIRFKFTKLD